MSITFTPATGQLLLSRDELVVLADEVGAHRVRGLDGVGLVHVGVDSERAAEAVRNRGLGPDFADFLGSEAFWVRRVLDALRVANVGDRAVLVVRHEFDRVTSHLAAVHGSTGVVVKAIYDEPVALGPIATVACPAYLVEEIDPSEFALGMWSATELPTTADAGVTPSVATVPRTMLARLRPLVATSADAATADLTNAGFDRADALALVADVAAGALPLVRLIGWWRDDDGEHEATVSWMEGRRRHWLFPEGDGSTLVPFAAATADHVATVVRTRLAKVFS